MEIVTLSNGLRVGNFSSPHPFEFEDGIVLPAVGPEESEDLKVTFIEKSSRSRCVTTARVGDIRDAILDIELKFELSDAVKARIHRWHTAWSNGQVQVVLVPLPMLQAMKTTAQEATVHNVAYTTYSPFRAIRTVSRVNKKISITKFCI